MSQMRLIFMGTPEAAVPTLRRCLEERHIILSVWTQPDRPAGRGKKLTPPPVKEFALSHGLSVHQPTKIKTPDALDLFRSYDADAAVVVAYGRILPPGFLSAPRFGCINLHFSVLPSYRGAAPVNWAIARGETETGVTTMKMDEGLDTGDILLQRSLAIAPSESAPELMERLATIGADLLAETLTGLDTIVPRKQDDELFTLAPMLRKEDGWIDWTRDATDIERRMRGFQPWPGAYTFHQGRRLVIWKALPELAPEKNDTANTAHATGEVINADGDLFSVSAGGGSVLRILELQPEAKRRMSAKDFLNGAPIRQGERLG
jgi:methionyl-tRNA formyltransferase